MASIVRQGGGIDALLAKVSIITRPEVHRKKAIRGDPSHITKDRRSHRLNPTPQLLWNLVSWNNQLVLGGRGGADRRCEQSYSTTLEVGGQSVCVHDDSVVTLDTKATANLVCFEFVCEIIIHTCRGWGFPS